MMKHLCQISKMVVLIVLLPLQLMAQSAPTMSELRQGFREQYILHHPQPDMSTYDKVSFHFASVSEMQDIHRYVSGAEAIRKAGSIQLPPSLYVFVDDMGDSFCSQSEAKTLYWVGSLNPTSLEKEKKLKDKLKRKYGSVLVNDSTEAIPVKWYDGKLFVTEDPDWYANHLVSARQSEYGIKGGNVVRYNNKRVYWGSLSSDVFRIQRLRKDLFTIDDSRNIEVLRRVQALNLLARDLSRAIGYKQNPESDNKGPEYTLVITTDSTKKSHLAPLFPDSLTENDTKILKQLSDAMEQQPRGILQAEWDMNGTPFNALFIKATFKERGGFWVFDEYRRVHYRTGNKIDSWNRGRKGYEE